MDCNMFDREIVKNTGLINKLEEEGAVMAVVLPCHFGIGSN